MTKLLQDALATIDELTKRLSQAKDALPVEHHLQNILSYDVEDISKKLEQAIGDKHADALHAGCGTEIHEDALKHGYVPRLLGDNGESGDRRLSLWLCGDVRAINTNGGAIWEESDPDGFADLQDQIKYAN